MRTIKLLTIVALCIAPSITLDAQEHLDKAIADFAGNENIMKYVSTSVEKENSESDGRHTSFAYTYVFNFPNMGKFKSIKPLIDAFYKDCSSAYKVLEKSAGINDKVNIAYGEKLEKQIKLGDQVNNNYKVMLFRDAQDSLRRYAYGISWTVDPDDQSVSGSIYKIYSLDPKKAKKAGKHNTIIINSDGSIDISDNNVIRHVPFNSDAYRQMQDRMALKGTNTNTLVDNIKTDSIKTSTDFIKKFGIIRSTYINNNQNTDSSENQLNMLFIDKSQLNTALVNKMLELCTNYANLLDKHEIMLCREGLTDMKKVTTDRYLYKLLDLTITKIWK